MIDTSKFVATGSDVRGFSKKTLIHAPIRTVWNAWTNGDAFARSYDPASTELRADIELAIGGKYEWLWDGEMGSNGCQILSYVPERMVSFSWNAPPSQPLSRAHHTWVVVEFTAEDDSSTRIALHHQGFGPEAHWAETRDYFASAWGHVLGQFTKNLDQR